MAPKISVVMSVYNGEDYLVEAVKSILNQDFVDFEFIIIDDGSTDQTLKILRSFEIIDNRVVIITRENKGLIASLNEGMLIAKGKYIARMDADDISIKERFKKQYHFLESNLGVGVCGSWIEVFGKNIKPSLWKLPLNNSDLKSNLIFSVPFAHPSVMMRRELVNKFKLQYNDSYKDAEDYKFWLDFSMLTKFANIPEALVRRRSHQKSITRISDKGSQEKRFLIISKIQNEILQNLDVKTTREEKLMHFLVSSNERIGKNKIDLDALHRYFSKVLKESDREGVITYENLHKTLAKRFFVFCILTIKRDKYIKPVVFFSILFWYGAILAIKKNIQVVN